MIEFRISNNYINKRKRGFIWSGLIGAVFSLLVSTQGETSIVRYFIFAFVAAIFMGGLNYYGSRKWLKYAQSHVIKFDKDKLILDEGGIKSEIPYGEIKEITVNLRKNNPTAILLKLSSGYRLKLDNYESILALKDKIFENTPNAKKLYRKWLHV